MSKLDPNYIVGLVDGDGSFTVYVRHPEDKKSVKRRITAEPKFYLRLIEGNKEILYEFKKFFRCGEVYFQKDKRENHQDCYRYEVFNRKDLNEIIIPFFKKHLPRVPSRRKDFNLFCQIVKLMNQGKHLTKEGLLEIHKIKQKMH